MTIPEKSHFLSNLRAGITTQSAAETIQIGTALAAMIPENTTIALHGDLGAGKTTFVKGLAEAWEIKDPITSPSFNLYSIHQGSRQLIHLDAYRLPDGSDFDSLMIEDFMKPPWCLVIEWPKRVEDCIPHDAWHLYLKIDSKLNHSICLKSEIA